MWQVDFGVNMIDSQAQGAPSLISQLWWTISASTRCLLPDPLWLVTHSTLSYAHHIFYSRMYQLARMEMAKFLCIFVFIKIVLLLQSHQPKPLPWSKFLWCGFWLKLQKMEKIIRSFVGTSQVIILQISGWQAIFCVLKTWKSCTKHEL